MHLSRTRSPITGLGVLALVVVAATAACSAGADSARDSALAERTGTVKQPQIDPFRTYFIFEGGLLNASAWAGPIASGANVEYWVSKPRYLSGATRTFKGSSSSCQTFRDSMCGSEWAGAGATFYRAVVVQSTLDCAFPPGPCTPPRDAVSFLGSGSYQTADSAPYAWTYVEGNAEYWAMNHTIPTGGRTLSTQSPISVERPSFDRFISAMCAMSTPPSMYFQVYYEPVSNFCSVDPC